MSRLCACLALWLALLAVPEQVAAFADYEVFGLAPLEGGGGGRYFTGSPLDSYSCSVCHRGGVEPALRVVGLPETGYVPGTAYDVLIDWLFPQFPHALNLEIVTPAGQTAGAISLPDNLEAPDRCGLGPMGDPAAHLVEELAPRQVLYLQDCGATRLRFRFTAPADPEVLFTLGAVRTDMSEKPEGDGAIALQRTLYRQGYQPPASSDCSLAAPLAPAPHAGLGALLACVVLLSSRRRRRAAI